MWLKQLYTSQVWLKACCISFLRNKAALNDTFWIPICLAVLVNAGCMRAHSVGYWYIPWDGQMMAWQLSYASAPLILLFAYVCVLSSQSLYISSLSHRICTWSHCALFVVFLLSASGTLTHWGRVTHICVSKLSIIGSDNGLSPGRRQAIIWTNAGILLIRTLGTNFSEILNEIHAFSFKKMHLKMSSAKWRPFCLGLNVLMWSYTPMIFAVPLLVLGKLLNWPSCQ